MARDLVRDRLTWVAYTLLAWFAYLQAAPGLVVTHLREELDLSYAVGGLYVAAFAAGSTLAGLLSPGAERRVGRRAVLWSAPAVLAAGTVGLVVGRTPALTLASVLVMGLGGGLLLATVQAVLADHHEDRRTVALAEANVAASTGYLALVGMLALASALGAEWRTALLVSLVVPAAVWWRDRGLRVDDAPDVEGPAAGGLPPAARVAVVILVCTTAVEWSVTAWGATFAEEATGVAAGTAVSLMGAYFGGFLAGRVLGSRLARTFEPTRLLGGAIAVAGAGFALLWSSGSPVGVACGLGLLGIGIGNLFPMAVSVTVAVAPGQAGRASGRAVTASSAAVLLAPVTVGAVADATSLAVALLVVPLLLAAAAAGLVVLVRAAAGAARESSR